MIEIFLGPIITIILLIIILFLLITFKKSIGYLLINSLIGIIAFTLLNFTPFFNIKVNLWSILIVAISGIFGVIIVAILNFFGLLF